MTDQGLHPGFEEDDEDGPEDDVEMSFFDHIGELRSRLVKILLGIIPGMAACWYFREWLLEALLQPLFYAYKQLNLGRPQIHFANPVDPFVAYLKISIIGGFLVSAPWFFWQVWGFIAPGLYRKEKRYAIPFVAASTFFFVGGAIFGYWEVLPIGFETLLEFSGTLPSGDISVTPTLMINEYLSFSTRLLLAFGIVFQVPVMITMLATVGLVNWRQLLKFFRWWTVIAAVLSAMLTPQDVGSMLMMFVPLLVLYLLSVGLAFIVGRKRDKKKDDDAEQAKAEGFER